MSKQIPNHLKHKPIYILESYSPTDGQYKNNTDVVGLSLGRAQWCGDEFTPSVKVWRKNNGRWSRQSEETTLTRALDLATLIIKILDSLETGKAIEPIYTVFGDLSISEAENSRSLKQEFMHYLTADNKKRLNDIKSHIRVLYEAISDYQQF